MKYIGIFTVLIMILLQGCQPRGPSVTFGEVVDKQHRPASSSVMLMPVITSTGTTTVTNMIPMVIYHPEQFRIVIYGQADNGEFQNQRFFVNQNIYEAVAIGDTFEYDSDMASINPPREQRRRATAEERRQIDEN